MQSLALRTPILNNKSSRIAVGERQSLGARPDATNERNWVGGCNAVNSLSFAATRVASSIFVGRMESDSRAQAIASDAQCTHDEVGFTRIGSPTKAIHKRMDAMLADKTECTI